MKDDIRSLLRDLARLSVPIDQVKDDQDLYKAGMTSHASITVMLALENKFDVEFPDALLRRNVFSTIDRIHEALLSLVGDEASAPMTEVSLPSASEAPRTSP